MATMITEECIACGACLPECPNQAIFEGVDIFHIDHDRCTECVGFHAVEQCAAVCPVDCCLPDPLRAETEAVLYDRARRLHPGWEHTLSLTPQTSRFRVPTDVPAHPPT